MPNGIANSACSRKTSRKRWNAVYDQTDLVLKQRQQVLNAAYQLHPERFVRNAPTPPAVPTEAWINKPVQLT